MQVFVIAALHAAPSGWLYAHLQRLVNPAVLGGAWGSSTCSWRWSAAPPVWGAVLGAALLTLLKQWLQDVLPQLFGHAGNFEIIVFGVLVLLVLHRARGGLWPVLSASFRAAKPRPLPEHAAHALPRRTMPANGQP
jgi:branched-chain amino acid transport system permease protein